jgi:hypothetical protein
MVFTRQVGALDALRGELSDRAVDLLQAVTGDCSAPLRHNANVTIRGKLTINNCQANALWIPCGEVVMSGETIGNEQTPQWAKAVSLWVEEGGGKAYVDCVLSNRAGSTSGAGVRVYLLRSSGSTPNVRPGDVIQFLLDATGNAVCISDVNDDPIGTVKAWNYAPGDAPLPGGWRVVDDLVGRTPIGFLNGNEVLGTLGAVGGTTQEGTHDLSDTEVGGGETSTETVDAEVEFGGPSVATGSGFTDFTIVHGVIAEETVELTAEDAELSEETTGFTVSPHNPHRHHQGLVNSTFDGGGVDVHWQLANYTLGEVEPLAHTVNDPGHRHVLEGDDLEALVYIDNATHTHAFYPSNHRHGIGAMAVSASHTHSVSDEGHSHTWTHIHEAGPFEHGENDNLQPYVVKTWIERYE